MADKVKPTEQTLLAEYAAAQADYMHNDMFAWQIGGILLAGTFVFWGVVLDKKCPPLVTGVASLMVTLLLSIWIMYAHRYRQTFLCKLHRMQEIERLLGMESHTRWVASREGGKAPFYQLFGPRGLHMDVAVYSLASLGSPIIGLAKSDLSWSSLWLALPVPPILVVIVWISQNERRLKEALIRHSHRQKSDPHSL
jgi:hypothetical protein